MIKHKRKFPVIRSSYERKKNLPGIIMTTPGPYLIADTIHYINKQGRLIHDSNSLLKEIRKKVMSQSNFNKIFSNPLAKSSIKNPKFKSAKFIEEELELTRLMEIFGE